MWLLVLAFIGEVVTAATCKDSPAIKDRHTSAAASRGTPEIHPLAAEVTGKPFQFDRIFKPFPLASPAPGAIGENDPVIFRADNDVSSWLTIPCPNPAESVSTLQHTIPLQSPHIQLKVIGRRAFAT
jgi:hypothetical protein